MPLPRHQRSQCDHSYSDADGLRKDVKYTVEGIGGQLDVKGDVKIAVSRLG